MQNNQYQLNEFQTKAPKNDSFIKQMQNISGMNCPIDPRGNPKFIKNIYNSIEKEYETKKRFCK